MPTVRFALVMGVFLQQAWERHRRLVISGHTSFHCHLLKEASYALMNRHLLWCSQTSWKSVWWQRCTNYSSGQFNFLLSKTCLQLRCSMTGRTSKAVPDSRRWRWVNSSANCQIACLTHCRCKSKQLNGDSPLSHTRWGCACVFRAGGSSKRRKRNSLI